jgi:hypothetical protein
LDRQRNLSAMHNVTDILGHEVHVKDWIAVSFREGNNAALRVGQVIGFGRRNLNGGKVDTMAVEWYLSSGYKVPDKPTSIDSCSAKFVVISSPI